MFGNKEAKVVQKKLKSVYGTDQIDRVQGVQEAYVNIIQRARLNAGKLSNRDVETLQLSLNNRTLLSLLAKSQQAFRYSGQSTSLRISTSQHNIVMRDPDPPHKLVAATDRVKKGTRGINDAIHDDLNNAIDKIKELTNVDLGTVFGDTSRPLTSAPQKAGAAVVSWHKTGRAIDLGQGSFGKGAIKKEASGKDMFFRIYLKYKDEKANESDLPKEDRQYIVKFDTVNKKEFSKNPNKNIWYVDVTAILEAFGFERIKAQTGWEKTQTKMEWWHYEKRNGLTMYDALREIYTEEQIVEGYKKIYKSDKKKYKKRLISEGFPEDIIEKLEAKIKITKPKPKSNVKKSGKTS